MELHDSAIVAAGLLTNLFNLLRLEIVDKGIDEKLDTEVEEVDGPRLKDFHLPFFFEMTGLSRPEADDGDRDNDL